MEPSQAVAVPGLATALTLVSVVVGAGLAVVGAAVARQSLVARRSSSHLRGVGVRARGVVVDTQIHSRGRGDTEQTSFRPVITFTAASGREVTTVAGPLTTASWFERTPVEVLHDPDDPEHAEVLQPVPGSRVERHVVLRGLLGVVLLLVGLAVVAVALVGLLG